MVVSSLQIPGTTNAEQPLSALTSASPVSPQPAEVIDPDELGRRFPEWLVAQGAIKQAGPISSAVPQPEAGHEGMWAHGKALVQEAVQRFLNTYEGRIDAWDLAENIGRAQTAYRVTKEATNRVLDSLDRRVAIAALSIARTIDNTTEQVGTDWRSTATARARIVERAVYVGKVAGSSFEMIRGRNPSEGSLASAIEAELSVVDRAIQDAWDGTRTDREIVVGAASNIARNIGRVALDGPFKVAGYLRDQAPWSQWAYERKVRELQAHREQRLVKKAHTYTISTADTLSIPAVTAMQPPQNHEPPDLFSLGPDPTQDGLDYPITSRQDRDATNSAQQETRAVEPAVEPLTSGQSINPPELESLINTDSRYPYRLISQEQVEQLSQPFVQLLTASFRAELAGIPILNQDTFLERPSLENLTRAASLLEQVFAIGSQYVVRQPEPTSKQSESQRLSAARYQPYSDLLISLAIALQNEPPSFMTYITAPQNNRDNGTRTDEVRAQYMARTRHELRYYWAQTIREALWETVHTTGIDSDTIPMSKRTVDSLAYLLGYNPSGLRTIDDQPDGPHLAA